MVGRLKRRIEENPLALEPWRRLASLLLLFSSGVKGNTFALTVGL